MSESVPDSASDLSSNRASELSSVTPCVPKPGGLLKRKRLENDWTKGDAAKTLLLSVQHIEALENDEYDKLPGATYVVGYWRNYASLLKIDISESIEFHKNNLGISSSAIALEAGHRRTHGHPGKARKRSGLVFFVLSVMFLAGIWYWQNPDDNLLDWGLNERSKTNVNNDDNQPAIADTTPIAVIEPADYSNVLSDPNFSDDIANADIEVEDATTAEDEDNVENNIEDNKDLLLNPSVGNHQADLQEADPAPQKQEVETTQRELTPSTEAVTEIENVDKNITENVSEPADETPVAVSPNWIFLSVDKKSWLDVRDVIGDKLIYRIAKAGESISLKGQPPFYVFIGVADGVRVEYLGEPIEFKIKDDSLVARFRVGREAIKNTEKKNTEIKQTDEQ